MIPWTYESLYLSSSGFRNLVTWYALVVGEEHFHLWFRVFPIGKQWRKKKLRLLFFFDTIPEFPLCIKIYLLSFHIQWLKELNITTHIQINKKHTQIKETSSPLWQHICNIKTLCKSRKMLEMQQTSKQNNKNSTFSLVLVILTKKSQLKVHLPDFSRAFMFHGPPHVSVNMLCRSIQCCLIGLIFW